MSIETTGIAELERLVRQRTHDRVRNLQVMVNDGRIVLQGIVGSFHLKQLAQHGIMDILPMVRLVNSIAVRG